MRVLCGILCVMLIGFTAVQYNDPDALFWASAYGAGAIWCGLAALRPALLRRGPARWLVAASVVLAGVGVVVFWPDADRWWSIDVWWPKVSGETSREGMGMMILAVCVLIAASFGLRRT